MKIDYKKLNQKSRNQKFKTLYERIPFLKDMAYRERTWWIRYYKLRTSWTQNFPDWLKFYPDEYPVGDIKPWEEPNYLNGCLGENHQLNCDLLDIEMLFLALGYDWIHTKLEEIEFPELIECNFSDLEGCSDCKYRFKCELKEM